MKNTILMAQNLKMAQDAEKEYDITATVEAEYGNEVIEGTEVTMAHHVTKYKDLPAPSMQNVQTLKEGWTILVSHIDLDTLGGVMRLMGRKSIADGTNQGFWKAVEFIDLNGPHHLEKVKEYENEFNAYWAWSQNNRTPRFEKLEDVTDLVMSHILVLEAILEGDEEFLKEGEEWAKKNEKNTNDSLVEENEKLRVFVGTHFIAASYYSPKIGVVTSITVSFNTMNKSITVATSDGSINCCELMQELFGPEAGGHAGIAGTPRGQEMNLDDLYKTVQKVKESIKKG